MLKLSKRILLFLILTLFTVGMVCAQHGHEEEHDATTDSHKEGFNAGEFVMEHVSGCIRLAYCIIWRYRHQHSIACNFIQQTS